MAPPAARMPADRKVLIVTGGTSPQVVTETVFALARRADDPFVPDDIICVVTKTVAKRFHAELEARLHELAAEWEIEEAWGDVNVQIPTVDGEWLDDVRSHEQTVVFGDFVSEVVRRQTSDDDARVHLSIAGGRKTMSYYGGAAMALWGRPRDELSHVLVGVSAAALAQDPTLRPEDFESHPDFWYPSRADREITTRQGRVVNAREATIDLSDAPFVPLRGLLPPWVIESRTRRSYAVWVQRVRAALAPALTLHLVPNKRRIVIGDLADFTMEPVQFALYQLMAEWARERRPGAGPEGSGPEHRGWLSLDMLAAPESVSPNPVRRLIEIYQSLKLDPEEAKALRHSIKPDAKTEDDGKANAKFLSPYLSRIRSVVEQNLVLPALYERFAPRKIDRRQRRFGLSLLPREITIE